MRHLLEQRGGVHNKRHKLAPVLCVIGLQIIVEIPLDLGNVSVLFFVRSAAGKQDGSDSGFGLYLSMEGLSLGLQTLKLHLDKIRQSLPHFHRALVFSSERFNKVFHAEWFPHKDCDLLAILGNVGFCIWQDITQTYMPKGQDDWIQGTLGY